MQQKRLVLLAGDPLHRRLLTEWIAEAPDLCLLASTSDPAEAVGLSRHHQCECVAVDSPGSPQILSADFAPGIRFSCHRPAVMAQIRGGSGFEVSAMPAVGPIAIAIVAETGGPLSLSRLWRTWSGPVAAPILVAQHMPLSFTEELVRRLNSIGTISCRVAIHGTHPEPGVATFAPGGVHMTLGDTGEIILDRLASAAGLHTTADHLLTSVATQFGCGALGVILSGSGPDGLAGAEAIRAAGGVVVAEGSDTALVPGLAESVNESGWATVCGPVHELLNRGYQAATGGQFLAAS